MQNVKAVKKPLHHLIINAIRRQFPEFQCSRMSQGVIELWRGYSKGGRQQPKAAVKKVIDQDPFLSSGSLHVRLDVKNLQCPKEQLEVT